MKKIRKIRILDLWCMGAAAHESVTPSPKSTSLFRTLVIGSRSR